MISKVQGSILGLNRFSESGVKTRLSTLGTGDVLRETVGPVSHKIMDDGVRASDCSGCFVVEYLVANQVK